MDPSNTQKKDFSKAQIINVAAIETEAIKDKESQRIIDGYISVLKYFNLLKVKPKPLALYLIRNKLKKLVQKEFNLYNSFHTLKSKNAKLGSTEFVSYHLQERLSHVSGSVSIKIDELIERGLLDKYFKSEIYRYKLPLINKPKVTPRKALSRIGSIFKLKRRIR